jgi:GTP-binding protein
VFSDVVEIYVKAGDGGNGRLSFLHEKYREYGGPDGGDGGRGGNVVFVANSSWNTLYYYKTHTRLTAEKGEPGKAQRSHGKNGADLVVNVPVGTVIYNAKTGELLADLDDENEEAIIAKGGEGGFGNAHFTSSTRQKPEFAELGLPGEELTVRLELKLIADVGLVGLPNIGKSTFLSVVSAAKPKIANYPFTTLTPNLGVVEKHSETGFIIADIPGLIEGASAGKGLGDEFLRHVERTRVVVHFLDSQSEDLEIDFEIINEEMRIYNPEILDKPQILVVSKIDLADEKKRQEIRKKAKTVIASHPEIFRFDKEPILLSAATHEGVQALIHEIDRELALIPKTEPAKKTKVFTLDDVKKQVINIEKEGDSFHVSGNKIQYFVAKTDFSNPHGVARIYDILRKMGVIKRLEKKGAKIGDKIIIDGQELEYRG